MPRSGERRTAPVNIDLSNLDLSNLDLGNIDLGNIDLGNIDLGTGDLANIGTTRLRGPLVPHQIWVGATIVGFDLSAQFRAVPSGVQPL